MVHHWLVVVCEWLLVGSFLFTVASTAQASSSKGKASAYPHIPEPMVFDMIRPLGAHQGEFETNALATSPLSGSDRVTHWAPEAELAFADGMAIEFEFPFQDDRLTEYKLGLQSTFGTFNHGRSVHGVQYLGIYDRESHTYLNSLVYMLGNRFNSRWSTMSMIGLADISWSRSSRRNDLILNHSTFYDATDSTVLGLEVNYLTGHDSHILLMPQIHRRLTRLANIQFGLGVNKNRSESARPEVGMRLIHQF